MVHMNSVSAHVVHVLGAAEGAGCGGDKHQPAKTHYPCCLHPAKVSAKYLKFREGACEHLASGGPDYGIETDSINTQQADVPP